MKTYFYLFKKLFIILPAQYSRKLYLIFFGLAIAGVLETIGIALVIPIIFEILNENSSYFIKEYLLNFFPYQKLVIIKFFFLCILFLYIFKSIYLTKLEYTIQRFVQSVVADLTLVLFKKYTNIDYEFNVNNSSSILFRNLTREIGNFSAGILRPAIMFAKEFFITSLLLIMLVTINFKVSVLVLIFSLLFIFITQRYSKLILRNLGKKEQQLNGAQNKTLLESLQGIKFIKSYNLENLFYLKLSKILREHINVKTKSNTIRLLPRIWVELFLLLFLILLALIFNIFNYTFLDLVTFSSIFLVTMLKVLPSLISAVRVLNTLSSHKASMDLISFEFFYDRNQFKEKINAKKINVESSKTYEIQNIHFNYLNSENILEDISLKINTKNDIIGIIGESGSGKTTLVDILIGLLKPIKGIYNLDGFKIENNLPNNFFGYIPQNTFLFEDTLKNNILITNGYSSDLINEKLNKILEITQLKNLIESLPDRENTFIGENGSKISGGQKQRIGIARALMSNPKIIILDEATAGLDKITEEKILENLKIISKETSIIIISHNPIIQNYCNNIYNLKEKKLIKIK
jgi:ABC-type multidrug transport system fused ATPase/permease subunit